MTFAARSFRIIARIFYQTFMGDCFVIGGRIAIVTIGACNLPVNCFGIHFAIYKYFFPRLQRSHLSTSTFTFVFADYLFLRIGYLNKEILICMAIRTRIWLGQFDRGGRSDRCAGCFFSRGGIDRRWLKFNCLSD
jgi:hypothetical protein